MGQYGYGKQTYIQGWPGAEWVMVLLVSLYEEELLHNVPQ
jgi:hypothetical protein